MRACPGDAPLVQVTADQQFLLGLLAVSVGLGILLGLILRRAKRSSEQRRLDREQGERVKYEIAMIARYRPHHFIEEQ